MTEDILGRSTTRPDRLDGSVAIVTGAGQGIGRETARALARCGAAVGLLEICERAHQTAARITAEGGPRAACRSTWPTRTHGVPRSPRCPWPRSWRPPACPSTASGQGSWTPPACVRHWRPWHPAWARPPPSSPARTGLPMISPELCAAGLVGTILHAGQLRGQETGHANGLRLLGLDAAGQPLTTASARGPVHPALTGDPGLLDANRAVEALLAEHETELEQVPTFVRPVAMRAWRRASGLSIADARRRAVRGGQRQAGIGTTRAPAGRDRRLPRAPPTAAGVLGQAGNRRTRLVRGRADPHRRARSPPHQPSSRADGPRHAATAAHLTPNRGRSWPGCAPRSPSSPCCTVPPT